MRNGFYSAIHADEEEGKKSDDSREPKTLIKLRVGPAAEVREGNPGRSRDQTSVLVPVAILHSDVSVTVSQLLGISALLTFE